MTFVCFYLHLILATVVLMIPVLLMVPPLYGCLFQRPTFPDIVSVMLQVPKCTEDNLKVCNSRPLF